MGSYKWVISRVTIVITTSLNESPSSLITSLPRNPILTYRFALKPWAAQSATAARTSLGMTCSRARARV